MIMIINNLNTRVMKRALLATVERNLLKHYPPEEVCEYFWNQIKDHCELKEDNGTQAELAGKSSRT